MRPIGEIIFNHLEKNKLTQKEAAQTIGLARSHFNQVINGKKGASRNTIKRIIDVLGIDVTEAEVEELDKARAKGLE